MHQGVRWFRSGLLRCRRSHAIQSRGACQQMTSGHSLRSHCRRRATRRPGREVFTWKHAVTEAAEYPEDLVVSKARLKRQLRNEVRRRVEGIAGSRTAGGDAAGAGAASGNAAVVEAASGAGGAHQEICSVVVAGDRGLRVLHRCAKPYLVVEIFYQTQSILPSPTEADRVLRV